MEHKEAIDPFRWLDADASELSNFRDFANMLVPGLNVVHGQDHHEILGPVLHEIILEPESPAA
jgi:hypothetical protein